MPYACHPLPELERLLSSPLPAADADRLARHLEECDRCAAAVDTLLDGGSLPALVREHAGAAELKADPPVADLIRRLRGLKAGDTRATSSPEVHTLPPSTDKEDESFAFLAPPRGGDELGWLGHYRVLKKLGQGGMGLVLLAEDTLLERPVALKVMLPALAADRANRDRFLREARAAAKLSHDHVVTIYQVGEERGAPFLAMQLLQGQSLDDYLKKDKRLSFAHVCRIGREAALGLAAAHERGLIHRDIKPANLWLEAPKGRVKVLDFGLARGGGDSHLTGSGMVLGTPAYMAPEQARAKELDGRADLWSLGVVLYRMCAGRLPFLGDEIIAVLAAVAMDEPPPLASLNPEVPPSLAELVHLLLAKDRDGRPASAQDVADRLQKIERELVKAAKASSMSLPAQRPETSVAPAAIAAPSAPPAPPPNRRRVALAAGGLAAALLLGGAIFKIVNNNGTTTTNESGTATKVEAPHTNGATAPPQTPPTIITGWPSREPPAHGFAVGKAGNIAPLVAFTDSGKTLLVVDGERVWRRPTAGGPWDRTPLAAECRKLYAGEPRRSALSADGKLLALGLWAVPGGSHHLVVWDVANRKPAYPGPPPKTDRPINGLAFDPDGQFLVTTDDAVVQVWTAADGAHPTRDASIPVPGGAYAIAVSPDGATRAGGTADGTVRLIDRATGRTRWQHTPAAGQRVDGVVFSPDGTRLAANTVGGHGMTVYDTATGTVVATIEGGNHQPAFSPDGRLLALCEPGGVDGPRGVKIFDLAGNKTVAVSAREHTGWIVCLAWSPDGTTLASLGKDDTLRLWDVPKPLLPASVVPPAPAAALKPLPSASPTFVFKKELSMVPLVAFPDGGRTVLVVDDERVSLRPLAGTAWLTQNHAAACRKEYQSDPHRSALSHDGKLLALAGWARGVSKGTDRLILWDVATSRPANRQPPPPTDGPAEDVAFSRDSTLVATTKSGKGVQLWTVVNGTDLDKGPWIPVKEAYSVAFTPDGSALAVGTNTGDIVLVDRATGKQRWSPKAPFAARDRVDGVAVSPDGRFVAGRHWKSKVVAVLKAANGEVVATRGSTSRLPAFSPDSRLLAVCELSGAPEARGVRLFDLAADRVIAGTAPEYVGVTAGLAWSPDGKTLAGLGRANALRLWEVP